MDSNAPSTLVLYAKYTDTLSYYDDWLEAFLRSERFRAVAMDIVPEDAPERLKKIIGDFDLLVLLHSTNADMVAPLNRVAAVLNRRRGKLLSFVGNEVNLPGCFMADKLDALRRIDPDFIATQLPLEAGQYLFGGIGRSRVVAIPHALNPSRFRPVMPQAQRAIDIGARTYRYVPALGDRERNDIVEYFQQARFQRELAIDIRTDQNSRFDAAGWAQFLNSLKATISTEAGSYFLEKDDATVRAVMEYVAVQGRSRSRMLYSRLRSGVLKKVLPKFIRSAVMKAVESSAMEKEHRAISSLSDDRISSDDIIQRFFANYRNPVSGKCISSRHFDAAGTKTLQIMFPGRFNGILEADVHYIALQRDFSNIDAVLAKLRDPEFRRQMTDRTYDHILANHTYEKRLERIRALLS